MNIKARSIILALLAILISLSLVSCGENNKDAIAKVDGEVIPMSEFEEYFNLAKLNAESQYGEGILAVEVQEGVTFQDSIINQIISELVIKKVIMNDIEKRDIKLTDEELKTDIDMYKEQMGGEEGFKKYLEINKIDEKQFREDIKDLALMNKHRKIIMDESEIKDKEVEKYFEDNKEELQQVKAKHILVQEKSEAEEILKFLEEGQDFEELAKEFSKDPGSALEGGDLPYFKRGTMKKEFEDAAFDLEVGEISQAIETDVGYHIIKLEDKKEDLNSLKSDIESILKEVEYEKYLDSLEKKASIEIFEENIEVEDPKKVEDANDLDMETPEDKKDK